MSYTTIASSGQAEAAALLAGAARLISNASAPTPSLSGQVEAAQSAARLDSMRLHALHQPTRSRPRAAALLSQRGQPANQMRLHALHRPTIASGQAEAAALPSQRGQPGCPNALVCLTPTHDPGFRAGRGQQRRLVMGQPG
jgi:hypothetical protein